MDKYIDKALEEKIISIRRKLHANPEVGFDLENTANTVKSELEALGCEVKTLGNGCIYTVIHGEKEGKCLLLRADMDALPIKEETRLEFASTNGNMHACGHDMHTAMLLGCAQILTRAKEELCGSVKLMFQPAEEVLMGCSDAVNCGILEDPKPDMAVFLHVLTNNDMKTGTAIVSGDGVCAPAATFFEIEVLGKSAHSAEVSASVDALRVGAEIVCALDSISAREVGGHGGFSMTLGQISAGRCHNVISDRCMIKGAMRCFDTNTLDLVLERINEIANYTAKAHRARAKALKQGSAPTLVSNGTLSKEVCSALSKHIGKDLVIDGEILARKMASVGKKLASGSEDFAIISHRIPTVMIGLCAGNRAEGHEYPLHNPRCTFDEKALLTGAKCYGAIALEILKCNEK